MNKDGVLIGTLINKLAIYQTPSAWYYINFVILYSIFHNFVFIGYQLCVPSTNLKTHLVCGDKGINPLDSESII